MDSDVVFQESQVAVSDGNSGARLRAAQGVESAVWDGCSGLLGGAKCVVLESWDGAASGNNTCRERVGSEVR